MATPPHLDPAEMAKLGALLAGKGLTPDEVAVLIRDHALPVLDEAARLVELGADVDDIQFEVRPADRPTLVGDVAIQQGAKPAIR